MKLMNREHRSWLVAVGAGRWQCHGIRSAQAAGLRVMALDGDPNAIGFAIADAHACVDIRDPEEVLKVVKQSGIGVGGAISFVSEVGLPAAAVLHESLQLPGPGIELTQRMLDKEIQRRIWDQAGCPIPKWRALSDPLAAQEALAAVGLPAIVKPVDSSGSRGVSHVRKSSELKAAVTRAFNVSRSGRIIIESLLPGSEYTVETFSHDGHTTVLAVTVKVKVPGSSTVAMELHTPDLPDRVLERISTTAIEALEALGYGDGPGHTEIMYADTGELGLVEAAGRGGGFLVFDALCPLVSGVDLATACALQAVGLDPQVQPCANRSVCLRFIPASPGIVSCLDGFNDAEALEGVTAGPLVEVGYESGIAECDADRLAYILVSAESPDQAITLADRAEAQLKIVVQNSQ